MPQKLREGQGPSPSWLLQVFLEWQVAFGLGQARGAKLEPWLSGLWSAPAPGLSKGTGLSSGV